MSHWLDYTAAQLAEDRKYYPYIIVVRSTTSKWPYVYFQKTAERAEWEINHQLSKPDTISAKLNEI